MNGSGGWLATVLSILGLLGGLAGLGSFVIAFAQRSKLKADTTDVLTDTAISLADALRSRVSELTTETEELRIALRATRSEAEALMQVIHKIRITVEDPVVDPTTTLLRVRNLVDPLANGRP
jgi:hypothetical protein